MSSKEHHPEEPWQGFYGPNLGVVIELYEKYTKDPGSVDEELRELFERWGPPPSEERSARVHTTNVPVVPTGTDMMKKNS